MLAAQIMGRRLVQDGIFNFQVVEGYIQFVDDDDNSAPECLKFAHTWIKIDFDIVDPTIGQFREIDEYEYFRIEEHCFSPEEYLKDCILNTDHPDIFFSDSIIPEEIEKLLKLDFNDLHSRFKKNNSLSMS
jgi:hypothetical protein